ncbi:terminase small subunit [Oricola sp.]|uniref:terminase small subunit n=1 Tax=Oricola sp. TaxID=1979950 RepID=UPI003BAD24BB
MALTDKQKTFVKEFLVDLNATQAAIRAHYSRKTAYSQGSRLLKNVEVQSAIRAAMAQRSEQLDLDAKWVLQRLFEEADAKIGELYDDDNCLLPVREWPEVFQRGLVTGIETYEEYETTKDKDGAEIRSAVGRVVKIKLSERIKRTELIGKHGDISAFREQVDLSATVTPAKAFMEQVSGLGIRPQDRPQGVKPRDG